MTPGASHETMLDAGEAVTGQPQPQEQQQQQQQKQQKAPSERQQQISKLMSTYRYCLTH
jgi:hypothetical protein